MIQSNSFRMLICLFFYFSSQFAQIQANNSFFDYVLARETLLKTLNKDHRSLWEQCINTFVTTTRSYNTETRTTTYRLNPFVTKQTIQNLLTTRCSLKNFRWQALNGNRRYISKT